MEKKKNEKAKRKFPKDYPEHFSARITNQILEMRVSELKKLAERLFPFPDVESGQSIYEFNKSLNEMLEIIFSIFKSE